MSRFVSAGTAAEPVERDEQWLQAQQELEDARRLKEEQSRATEGKTLFEVLQANKAAKQEAFEEAAKLKNQFRSLDDDEVDFLDAVLESTRAQEAAVRKETTEQLELFRKQQEELEKATLAEQDDAVPIAGVEEETWHVAPRKRKRTRDKEVLVGVKLRKSSSSTAVDTPGGLAAPTSRNGSAQQTNPVSSAKKVSPAIRRPSSEVVQTSLSQTVAPPAAGLGLGGYSSDDG